MELPTILKKNLVVYYWETYFCDGSIVALNDDEAIERLEKYPDISLIFKRSEKPDFVSSSGIGYQIVWERKIGI